jgi:hypothetical protein
MELSDRMPYQARVEASEVHELVPRSHEVTHELAVRVITGVDLRDASELGVRADNEVDDAAARSGDLARHTTPIFVHVLR